MKKILFLAIASALLTLFPLPVGAQTPASVPASMQQLRGNVAHIPTPLKDGQFFIAEPSGKVWEGVLVGGTVTNLLVNPDAVPSINGLTTAVSFLAGSHLTVNTSSPNITYDLALTGVTAGTYGDGTHVGQIAVNTTGQITGASNVAISFPVTSVGGSGGTTGLTLSGGTTGAVTLTLGGTLAAASGGTGTTLGAEPPLGNPASNGQALVSTTSGTRSWYTIPASGTVTLAGDVTGPSGSNTVAKINGIPVSSTVPPTGYVLKYTAIGYYPSGFSGDVSGTLDATVVSSIHGVSMDPSAPSAGQVWIYDTGSGSWMISTPPWVKGTAVDNETPSGTVNGSNTSFTVSHTPNPGSLHLYVNGLRVGPSGYSLSGTTLTITAAPTSSVLADYRY